eukprot:3574114-Amphidinium_carterae.1
MPNVDVDADACMSEDELLARHLQADLGTDVSAHAASNDQLMQDEAFARSLQEMEHGAASHQQRRSRTPPSSHPTASTATTQDEDEAFARRLQAEEERRARQQRARPGDLSQAQPGPFNPD